MVNFGEFLKIWSLRSNSVTRQVSFNRTKIGGKYQNSNATFWVIFKQCASVKTKSQSIWDIFEATFRKKIKIDLILVWFLSDFLHHLLHICLLCWSNKEVSSKQKRSSKLSSKESEPYATVLVNCTSKLLNFHLVKYVGKSIMCRKSCLWLQSKWQTSFTYALSIDELILASNTVLSTTTKHGSDEKKINTFTVKSHVIGKPSIWLVARVSH